ncbi:ABC transporter substrate-binding protein [Streptomyces sp. NPDC057257]|uniref:ABC transporter substrate-binding protein n=1 Tax=Streptomyces sp. NPDC057257 TaxID=3346071 RepID=UPI0036292600
MPVKGVYRVGGPGTTVGALGISRRLLLGAASAAAVSGCAGGASGGVGADGRVTVELWHGQADTARKAVEALVAEFNRTHPTIRVDSGGGGVISDAMLQKVTAALAAGSYPDVAYIFGSDLANIARSPRVVDLTDALHDGPTPWNTYWKPVRDAVTVNGRVRAAPALLDSLAVVYNRKLFRRAGVPFPEAGWSWDEFAATAKALTDPGRGVFGTGWPGTGDEDTVWRLWPMIWDLGGDVVAPDGKHIGFADEGVRALGTLARLAADKSVYVDPKPGGEQMYQAFQSGRIGMVGTGPWKLPDIAEARIDYGVVPLPTYSGRPVTISGPDTWTVFDNGSARSRAAVEFVRWMTEPAQDVRWDASAGSLPLTTTAAKLPGWRRYSAGTTGLDVFTDSLSSARVRPVHPAYPQISQPLGEAIVSVLLAQDSPAHALRRCAGKADAALRIPR